MRPTRSFVPYVLTVLTALLLAAPAEARKITVGVVANTIGNGTQVGDRQDEVLRTGAHWLREEFDPSQSREQQDRTFRAASVRGMRILPLVSTADTVLPSDPTAYAAWTAHMTGRYGPGGSFWRENPDLDAKLAPSHFEIWNEPYYPYSTGRVDPARYANVYIAAVAAGRLANPSARFLISATTDAKRWDGRWVNWTDAMFEARPDLGAYIDAVTLHLYHRGNPKAQITDGYIHDKFRRAEIVRNQFASRGVNARFWITELGWSTCSAHSECISEGDMAARMQGAMEVAADEWDFVDAVFMYHLRSWPGRDDDKEPWFGMLRADGTAKPAYGTFVEAVRRWGAPVYENAPQIGLIGPWSLSEVRERVLKAAPPGVRRRGPQPLPKRPASTRKSSARRKTCRTVTVRGKRVRRCSTTYRKRTCRSATRRGKRVRICAKRTYRRTCTRVRSSRSKKMVWRCRKPVRVKVKRSSPRKAPAKSSTRSRSAKSA